MCKPFLPNSWDIQVVQVGIYRSNQRLSFPSNPSIRGIGTKDVGFPFQLRPRAVDPRGLAFAAHPHGLEGHGDVIIQDFRSTNLDKNRENRHPQQWKEIGTDNSGGSWLVIQNIDSLWLEVSGYLGVNKNGV